MKGFYVYLIKIAFGLCAAIAIFLMVNSTITSKSNTEADLQAYKSKVEVLEAQLSAKDSEHRRVVESQIQNYNALSEEHERISKLHRGAIGAYNSLNKQMNEATTTTKKPATTKVDPEVKRLIDEAMKLYGHNAYLSDRLALDRSIPDSRTKGCSALAYEDSGLTASIIITFVNESFSIMMRTITSMVNRAEGANIKEIILVDDYSDHEDLGSKLDDFIEDTWHGLVRVIRAPQRLGIIRARLLGADSATGDVLVFIDCHCEANINWLNPIFKIIKEDRKTVVLPVINTINDETLEYHMSSNAKDIPQLGSFGWSLDFIWVPPYGLDPNRKLTDPIASATMAGGLFAMDRKYFYELGAYDEEMDGWGGENVEISFRIWQCGGRMVVSPCSHFGHIYRKIHPYTFKEGSVIETYWKNSARLAEVWLDDYKDHFYFVYPQARKVKIGDISKRVKLRRDLKCVSFQTFLDKQLPDLFIPNEKHMIAKGMLRNNNLHCIDKLRHRSGATAGVYYECHGLGWEQFFFYTTRGELRDQKDLCLDVRVPKTNPKPPYTVQISRCHRLRGNQDWRFESSTRHLIHVRSGLCLDEQFTEKAGGNAVINYCDPDKKAQKWSILSRKLIQSQYAEHHQA